ncbi:MAG TPA: pyruvate formate lyase family protein [Candidatus Brocadiia bacterium]|nr:pyruvate formate lyase family protein [Candidatus Brocadiia bacterium]
MTPECFEKPDEGYSRANTTANNPEAGSLLSPRIARLREMTLADREDFQIYRAMPFWRAFRDNAGCPGNLRRARAIAAVYRSFPAKILRDEMIVGIGVGEKYGDWGFPEFWAGGIQSADSRRKRVRESGLPEPFCSELEQIAGEVGDSFCAARHFLSDGSQFGDGRALYWAGGMYINHSVNGYEKLLRLGFEGIIREIDDAIARHEYRADDPLSAIRLTTLRGFREVAEAAGAIGNRYAEEAEKLAAVCPDSEHKTQFLEIAEVCRNVPLKPAASFREAVQSLWFGHLLNCLEDHVNANSIGRIDQILGPYYEADVAAGRLTHEEALEILEALWLKLYRIYDVQQATIGGQNPDGSDATNPVSYLCLEATQRLKIIRCLSVRFHKKTPESLFRQAMELVAGGGGVPFFFNDDAIIPAVVSRGIPLDEARGYAVIGCVEIVIPGRSNPHAVSTWTNLAKCLELAIRGGRDRDGRQIGPKCKSLSEAASAEELYESFAAQMRWTNRKAMAASNAGELAQEQYLQMPFHSLLTEDCIARGLDVAAGGARFNYHSGCAIGIPNVADSLAAVAKLVFDEKKLAVRELLQALDSDFADAEQLRMMLLRDAPKYGNDDDLPDAWAARASRDFCDDLKEIRTLRGGCCFAHLFSFVSHLSFGSETGALPDGRRAGTPLAYSLSPQQGNDEEGLTALMNSLAKIPHHLAAGSSSIIVEVMPELMRGENFEKTVSAFRCALERGVGQLQINVVSADTLREAQSKPELHRNLAVRVSGFSQRFVTLGRDMQDHIIARTKHGG